MPKLANELLNLCPMRPQTSTGRSPVLNLINLQQKPLTTSELRRTLPRGGVDVDAVLPTVTPVVTAIRDHGVSAALDYGEQFDHVRPESLQVPSTVIDQAVADLDPDLRAALEESIARVRAVHADQKPQPHTTELTAGGTIMVGPTPPSLRPAASSASPRCGPSAAPKPSRSWPMVTPTSNPST